LEEERYKARVNAETILKMLSLISEIFALLMARKKFWLLPIIIILFIFGILIILTQGSVVAPFIYTIF